MLDSAGLFNARASAARSSDASLFAAGDFADAFPAESDCGCGSGALPIELVVCELAGIELCIGLGDGLAAGAL
jgi:hypothetical protein